MNALKPLKHCLSLLYILVAIVVLQPIHVYASPKGKVNSLSKRYRNLDRKAERLAAQFNKLSSSDQSSLLSKLSGKYDDADNDDLPDFLDSGSGRCDSDVDDDGILDGDDRDDDNSSPSPSPSGSASPSPTGSQVEIHALIQNISASSITLNNTTFALNNSTEYLDDNNNTITRSAFSAGECVEVEGSSSGGNLIASKVKKDNDC